MSEQERVRVDVEKLRRVCVSADGTAVGVRGTDLEALLAVVDAARDYVRCRVERRGTGWPQLLWPQLLEALEPFTPAEEEFRAMVDRVPMSGRAFNERMQAEDRARRLAALGIEVVPVGAQAGPQKGDLCTAPGGATTRSAG